MYYWTKLQEYGRVSCTMSPYVETTIIRRASVRGEVYNGDYNGTLGPIGKPPSKVMVRTLTKWVERGNIVDINSSDNFPQGQSKFGNLVNGTRVAELGVSGYDFEHNLVVFNPLSESELTEVADMIALIDTPFRSATFLPRFDRDSNHGVHMYVDPKEEEKDALALQSRYPQIEVVTRNRDHFAKLLKGQVGMVTFQVYEEHRTELLQTLSRLNPSQDTSGSVFITPHGVDKAKTLLELLDGVYKRNPDETIIVGGDSPGTDGSLFGIPDVTKIAVGDHALIQKGVPGKVHPVKSPEGARRVFENKMKKTS